MKVQTIIIIFFCLVFLLSCSTSNFKNIEGVWVAEGYNCEDLTNLSEEIRIDKKDNFYFAIKLTGDNCIPAGDTTWIGEIIEDKIVGEIKGMNPNTREFEFFECEIYENLGLLFLSVDKTLVLKLRKKE